MRIIREESVPTDTSLVQLLQSTGMHLSPQETFWVIAYDSHLNVRTMIEISRDNMNGANIHLPSLIAAVVTSGAERFVVAHNHPNNSLIPTQSDLDATRWVDEATRIAGLYMEDHLILTPNGKFYSFATAGHVTQDYHLRQGGVPMVAAPTQKRKRKRKAP